MSALNFLIHFTAILCYAYTLYYDKYHIHIPGREKHWGRWKFLTFWNMNLQFAYFILSVINDLFGSDVKQRSKRSSLQVVRDAVFTALAFPTTVFVALSFWGLYAIDRELIFPKALDPYFPSWANHAMHSSIVVWMLIDLLISNHLKTCHKKSLLICGTFCLAYLIVINLIWYKFDFWVYPVLAVLPWPMKIAFMGCSFLSFAFFYFFCDFIRSSVSKEEFEVKQKKKN